jgi:hypothetical protein
MAIFILVGQSTEVSGARAENRMESTVVGNVRYSSGPSGLCIMVNTLANEICDSDCPKLTAFVNYLFNFSISKWLEVKKKTIE